MTEAAAEVVSEEASDVASTPPGAPEPVTVKPKKIVSFLNIQLMKQFDKFNK